MYIHVPHGDEMGTAKHSKVFSYASTNEFRIGTIRVEIIPSST